MIFGILEGLLVLKRSSVKCYGVTTWFKRSREDESYLPRSRSSSICRLISRSMNGVSPKGKYGGMRLCQISGAGRVVWKGLGLLARVARVGGLVGEVMPPRPRSLG